MNFASLLACAAINVGMAMVVLCLFSLLKKHPFFNVIYLPRCLVPQTSSSSSSSSSLSSSSSQPQPARAPVSRFRKSLRFFFKHSFTIPERRILQKHGLDALVLIRLFKFGINFFAVCSIIGFLILLPINYSSDSKEGFSAKKAYLSMDSFTISNIGRGSNWLWVHFFCLCFISFYALYLLYKEYSGILDRRIQQLQNVRHRPDQFTLLVREIPTCPMHGSHWCSVDHFFSKHHPHFYQSCELMYDRKSNDQFLELPVAFVSFKSRLGASLATESQQHVNPLLWITETAPEPRDVIWRNLSIPFHHLAFRKLGVRSASTLLTIFFAIPVTAVQGIAQLDNIKKWFPPAKAVQLIPGLNSVLTGYLPSAILNAFIYGVPYVMLSMAQIEGCFSRSRREMKACSMVFYFLVANVFFLTLLSGSLLHEIGESVAHPKIFPSRLAIAVSSQADFFITYILTNGLSWFALEILQPVLVIWHSIKAGFFCWETRRDPYLYPVPYFRVIPFVSLAILIGMVYAVVAPFLLPVLVVYFVLGYMVYMNQIKDVYKIAYETCGQFWPHIHQYIMLAIILMQITMIGLFGLKSKPAASISTIPLILITILFNEYCKIRFLPTFYHIPIQTAMENDELDEEEGHGEIRGDNAINAYRGPYLQPVGPNPSEPSSIVEPLL